MWLSRIKRLTSVLTSLVFQKAIPDNGRKFVEEWRRRIWTFDYLKRGWKRLEALGEAHEWVKDVRTEEEWADLMYRVNAWQEQWEEENAVPFIDDLLHS
ncbi:hypothetical protein NMY22_g205 [Coprinellus aureogranulatus]|nr:hypothetical protein NMY22_g205 [Coprinellus aureogranulatus]